MFLWSRAKQRHVVTEKLYAFVDLVGIFWLPKAEFSTAMLWLEIPELVHPPGPELPRVHHAEAGLFTAGRGSKSGMMTSMILLI